MPTASNESFTPTTDIDTFGWDLVYLSSLQNANSAIETLGSEPSSIAQEMKASVGIGLPQKTFKLDAHWNPWKFTWTGNNSSSGYIAQCEVSFKDTETATLVEWDDNTQKTEKSWNLHGGKTVIQFYLAYYDTSGNNFSDPNMIGGKQRDLCIRAAGEDPNDLPTSIKNAPFFSVVSSASTWQICPDIAAEDASTQILLSGFVDQLIKSWLNNSDNSTAITQVFASLNLGAVLAGESDSQGKKPLEWMLPSQVDYCIANVVGSTTKKIDLTKSMIACMAMAKEHHSTNWNSSQVDETILSRLADTSDSALVISKRMVVEHFLLPVVQEFPKNKDAVRWQFTSTGDTVENQNTVNLGKLPAEKGDAEATVDPNKFTFGVRNDEIHMEIQDITWKWSDKFECKANYFVSYKLELDKTDPKNPKLRVKQGSVDSCSVTVSSIGDDTGQILIDVAVGAAGTLFGAAIGGAIGAKIAQAGAQGGAAAAYDFTATLNMRLGLVAARGLAPTLLEDATYYASKFGIYVSEAVRAGLYKAGDLLELCFESKAKGIGVLIGSFAGVVPVFILVATKYTDAELQNDLGSLPSFTPTVQIGLGSIKWSNAPAGAEGFMLNEVILDGAMILGGKIVKG